ncbi:hypothetical protein YC2023_122881 [Brassica napus]
MEHWIDLSWKLVRIDRPIHSRSRARTERSTPLALPLHHIFIERRVLKNLKTQRETHFYVLSFVFVDRKLVREIENQCGMHLWHLGGAILAVFRLFLKSLRTSHALPIPNESSMLTNSLYLLRPFQCLVVGLGSHLFHMR